MSSCIICAAPLHLEAGHVCSMACLSSLGNREVKHCENCGKRFISKGPVHRFCCTPCQHEAKPYSYITCMQCGRLNRVKVKRRFCNKQCRDKFYHDDNDSSRT